MTGSDNTIEQEALTWLVLVNDADFANWAGLEDWLSADPLHAETYWALASRDRDLTEVLSGAARRSEARRAPRRSFGFRRALIAASVAAVVGVGAGFAWTSRPQPAALATAPGAPRQVVLADGSRAYLDGATRLSFDRRRPRRLRLEAGRVQFDVVHDEASFTVEAGGATVTDLGTVFDVTRLEDGVRVSVSEGRARIDLDGASQILSNGEGALATSEGIVRRPAPVDGASDWIKGRLNYIEEALPVVAQDLARSLGRPVTVAAALRERRFSGSVALAVGQDDLKARLERLLDVDIIESDGGWRLEPRTGA